MRRAAWLEDNDGATVLGLPGIVSAVSFPAFLASAGALPLGASSTLLGRARRRARRHSLVRPSHQDPADGRSGRRATPIKAEALHQELEMPFEVKDQGDLLQDFGKR